MTFFDVLVPVLHSMTIVDHATPFLTRSVTTTRRVAVGVFMIHNGLDKLADPEARQNLDRHTCKHRPTTARVVRITGLIFLELDERRC